VTGLVPRLAWGILGLELACHFDVGLATWFRGLTRVTDGMRSKLDAIHGQVSIW
jgi:predicted outer membrane lipoprotein